MVILKKFLHILNQVIIRLNGDTGQKEYSSRLNVEAILKNVVKSKLIHLLQFRQIPILKKN